MPYKIQKQGDKFCVVKSDGGKQIACHPNRPKAIAQMRALYAQEGVTDAQVISEDELLRLASEEETPVQKVAQETFAAAEAVWTDNADGLPQADVVIIRPGESLNRRFYSKEAISDAVSRGFWNKTPMFVDHGDPRMPRKRKVTDLAARIDSTYLGQEGEARGRVTFIRPEFAAFAKAAQESIGLSAVHEFSGQRFRGSDGHYHERVDKFVVNHSVDFVAFPAAGGGIAEFLPASESEDDVDWNSPLLTKEALLEHRPELVEEIKSLAAESDDDGDETDDGTSKAPVPQPRPGPTEPPPPGVISLDTVKTMIAEEAQRIHDSYQERDRKVTSTKQEVAAHLGKSGLPERIRTRLAQEFDGDEEYDSKAVQEAIDTAAEELKEAGWKGPVIRNLGDSTAPDAPEKSADPATLRERYPTMVAVEEQLAFVPRSGKKSDDSAGKAN